MNSALYVGGVMHRRMAPRAHRLRYRVFWILFDLDEMERLSRTATVVFAEALQSV